MEENEKTMLVKVQPELMNAFEFIKGRDRLNFRATVGVKVKNLVREIALTYGRDWKTDTYKVEFAHDGGLTELAKAFGIILDWSIVFAAYETVVIEQKKLRDEEVKQIKEKIWDTSWVHSFVADAKKYSKAGMTFEVQPISKEDYMKDSQEPYVNIHYFGESRSVTLADGHFQTLDNEYHCHSYTKLENLINKIAGWIEMKMLKKEQEEQIHKIQEEVFEKLKAIFKGLELNRFFDAYGVVYELQVHSDNKYKTIRFRYNTAPVAVRRPFSISGIGAHLTQEEFEDIHQFVSKCAEKELEEIKAKIVMTKFVGEKNESHRS